jgi:polyisoprenoid-binding protein YceI
MKRATFSLVLTVLGAIALSGAASAAERVLTLDPERTSIAFHLGATGHDVEGSFELIAGEIRFDTDSGVASGEIRIDTTGAETGNKKRDKTMHKKVLESEQYPLFLFRAERIEGGLAPTGSSELQLHGTLTIHGSEHPLTLSTQVEVEGDRLTATTSFPVPFVEWGMHDPSWLVLRVSKEVEVTVTAEGSVSSTSQASLR